MTKKDKKLLRQAAISELESLSLFLDTELGVTASMSLEEVADGLRELGLDPNEPPPAKIRGLLLEAAQERRTRTVTNGYVFVSNDSLWGEATDDEVKLLLLKVRCLARQERYEEALELTEQALRLDPNYWRARTNLGTLLALSGKLNEGEELFRQVSRDYPDNPKAVAAGLHGLAWVKETRYDFEPPAHVREEVSRLYAEALQLNEFSANTRASLFVNCLESERNDNDEKFLADSRLYEGFFDHVRLELSKRGPKTREKAHKKLPAWFRHLLGLFSQPLAGECGY